MCAEITSGKNMECVLRLKNFEWSGSVGLIECCQIR